MTLHLHPPATLQVISSEDYSLPVGSCYSVATSALYHWLCVSDHTYLRTLMLGYLSHKNRDEKPRCRRIFVVLVRHSSISDWDLRLKRQ